MRDLTESPIKVVGDDINIDIERMEVNKAYDVDYDGSTYRAKRNERGQLQFGEVVLGHWFTLVEMKTP